MGIVIEKMFAQLLFWLYDFIDTIGAIFNILTGTQAVGEGNKTLLEVFAESAVSTKVLLGLCLLAVIIAGASVAVKTVKNIVKFKTGGEPVSHAATLGQGCMAIFSSVVCIFFVFMFIAFTSMLLNAVNSVIAPAENKTLSQNLFDLSVEQSYVLDESKVKYRITDYLDEYGNKVQETDENGNPLYETDAAGNLIKDENGDTIPKYKKKQEPYYDYLRDPITNQPIIVSGWEKKENTSEKYSAKDIAWSMSPDEVFGVHEKDWIGLFEQSDQGYQNGWKPMVRLEAFNLFTAYLVAVVMLISMFMLSVGLVKRIYDIIVLLICMPLVCGTIPLDDGARFRAWRETFMSKLLVAFGAVIAINVFFMLGNFIMSADFAANLQYLTESGVLNDKAVSIFKMLLLLGGAMCMNASQTLIARILGTSADEGREAMQSFAMITSGVRLGAVGALGIGRMAMGAKRATIGGTNRYGRQRVGVFPQMFRGVNAVGERMGGQGYAGSRGAAFVRTLGRMGGNSSAYQNGGERGSKLDMMQPHVLHEPGNNANVNAAKDDARGIRPTNGNLRAGGTGNKSGAFKNDNTKKGNK